MNNWTTPVDPFIIVPVEDPLSFPPSTVSTISTTCSSSSFNSSSSNDRLIHLRWQLDVTRFTVQKVITPALVGFGVVGNLVNIAVLTRRWMKSSTNCYLTGLAIYDVLYLILAYILSLNHFDSVRTSYWFNRLRFPLVRPLTDTCSNTGVWLTLTFTVERYIGVCHPMKGKIWCTPRRAKVIVVVVCLSAALVTFPEFFEYTTSISGGEAASNETTGSRPIVVPSTFSQSPGYSIGYKYVNQSLFTFLPLILLSIFNALLLNAVIMAARWRQGVASTDKGDHPSTETTSSSNRGQQTQQRITVMLITVVVVFLVCQTPQAMQVIYVVLLNMRSEMDEEKAILLKITANVFNLLVIANCCSNFILYSSFSSKFRMTFHKLFCAPCTTRRKRASMEHLYSEAGVSALPPTPAHPVARRNGHMATVVCTELWPSEAVIGQTTPVNQVTTRVVKQVATEMVQLGAGAAGGGVIPRSSEKNRRLTIESSDHISPPRVFL